MSELTLVIDEWRWITKELNDYLKSLNGVLDVVVNEGLYIEIYIKYDSNKINYKILKMETLLFLDILKIPSIIAFDKHPKTKTLDYQIIIKDLCCEFCLKGMVDDLFLIEGIEKVDSNFENSYDKMENIIIDIKYNPNLIDIKKIKEIELEFNI